MTVGERIKEQRISLGLTQEDLAKKMGYSGKSAVCKAETSGDNITTTKVQKFADALNCTFEHLMGWDSSLQREVPENYVSGTMELIDLYSKASPETRKAVLNLLRTVV